MNAELVKFCYRTLGCLSLSVAWLALCFSLPCLIIFVFPLFLSCACMFSSVSFPSPTHVRCVNLASAGRLLLSLLALAGAAPPVQLARPEYIAALEAEPVFWWALERVSSFVLDVEWDARPTARATRLNEDGSFFNRWIDGTIVDVAISMAEAVHESKLLPQPFAVVPQLPPSVRRLVRRVASVGARDLVRRGEVTAVMLDVAQQLTPLSSRLVDAFMPRGALTIAGQLNVAFLEVLSRAIGSPAPRVPENMLFGFLVKGVVPSLGFYRPVEEPVAREFKRSNLEHLADVRSILERYFRSPANIEEARLLWDSTLDEVEKGLLRGPYSERQMNNRYERSEWRCMVRFAVWQGKLRCCDNAAASGHNDAAQCWETIFCTTADWPSKVAAAFYDEGVCDVLGGTDDVASAYRKVVNSEPAYTVVALTDPGTLVQSLSSRYLVLILD